MNQDVSDQRAFAFMSEVVPPESTPLEKLAEFKTEVDAIIYSIDHITRARGGLTQMTLADEMKISRAVLTKMRQGQASVPVGKLLTFIESTRSLALLEWYAFRLGKVVVSRKERRAEQLENQRLREENAELRERYKRVVGE